MVSDVLLGSVEYESKVVKSTWRCRKFLVFGSLSGDLGPHGTAGALLGEGR